MSNIVILISGVPGAGKSKLADWLSKRLCVPVVSYDRIINKVIEIAEQSKVELSNFYAIPYEFFWFELEENMRSSVLFLADYIFSDRMSERLSLLVAKYDYKVINVHLDVEPTIAYNRFMKRNKEDKEKRIRQIECSLEKHIQMTQQNRDFKYGDYLIEVDTSDFDKVSYEKIYEKVKKYL